MTRLLTITALLFVTPAWAGASNYQLSKLSPTEE